MSEQTRQSRSRADARRRARLAAQGRLTDEELVDEPSARSSTTTTPAGGGFLRRMFPPAPPLRGKPDPLAAFTYAGPLRGVVSTLYLLAHRPLAWIPFGIIWTISFVTTLLAANSLAGVVASLGTFAALVAAGWIGWPRPWAFGVGAAVFGYLGYPAFLGWVASQGLGTFINGRVTLAEAAFAFAFNGLFYAAVGGLAGFYGGYLRRRLAEPRPGQTRNRR